MRPLLFIVGRCFVQACGGTWLRIGYLIKQASSACGSPAAVNVESGGEKKSKTSGVINLHILLSVNEFMLPSLLFFY